MAGPAAPTACAFSGAFSLVAARAFWERLLLAVLPARRLPKKLRFEPRPTLSAPSLTVAPLSPEPLAVASSPVCEPWCGTLRKEGFLAGLASAPVACSDVDPAALSDEEVGAAPEVAAVGVSMSSRGKAEGVGMERAKGLTVAVGLRRYRLAIVVRRRLLHSSRRICGRPHSLLAHVGQRMPREALEDLKLGGGAGNADGALLALARSGVVVEL